MAVVVQDELLTALEGFRGTLIRPEDAAYDDARRIFNALIDKRPALIARCQGVADVVAALKFAREHDFEVAVRGGGHGVAGRCLVEGGIVIDLSGMKGIHVDQGRRIVRAKAASPGASSTERRSCTASP